MTVDGTAVSASKKPTKLAPNAKISNMRKNNLTEYTATKKLKKIETGEIDELFSRKKTQIVPSKDTDPKNQHVKRQKFASLESDNDMADTRGTKKKARPLTSDGLPIYTAEEMAIGKGGGSAECPWECKCCY